MTAHMSDGSVVSCAINVQNIDPTTGCVITSKVHKEASLTLGRNDLGELVVRADLANQSDTYSMHRVQLHKKFVKEGKASLSLPAHNVTLLLSNAAPDRLILFVRTLAVKSAKDAKARPDSSAKHPLGDVSSRARLACGVRRTFDEISPVTCQDVSALQESNGRQPLAGASLATPPSGKAQCRASTAAAGSSSGEDKENCVHPGARGTMPPPAKRMLSLHSQLSALTAEQMSVLDAVNRGKNVFFTGAAGTGKTFLLRRIIGSLPPAGTVVTASTGVAACHVNGTTLHSFAGMGSGAGSLEHCLSMAMQPAAAARWRACCRLVVDEVSMVDGRFFDKLEAVARLVRKKDSPFGGIQLILCGDFFQLPPVTKDGSKKVYCFQAACWKKCLHTMMELTCVKRQKDQEFIQMLSHVRQGRCSQLVERTLREASKNDATRDGIVPTLLCTHNEDVDALNGMHLGQLPGPVHTFAAVDSDPGMADTMNSCCAVPQVLELKLGAQVMLAKNLDVIHGLVNGSRGTVIGFQPGKQGFPIIKFYNGAQQTIGCEKWTVQRSGGLTLTRQQLPLKLAWSISVHKSQGMTLDCVAVSLSRAFECGQAYVALSRAQNLAGLEVSDFSPQCIRADPEVVEFYRRLQRSKEGAAPLARGSVQSMLED